MEFINNFSISSILVSVTVGFDKYPQIFNVIYRTNGAQKNDFTIGL